MVARSNRNSERSHWGNNDGNSRVSDHSGGGFYRRLGGRLATFRRARSGHFAALCAVSALLTGLAPVNNAWAEPIPAYRTNAQSATMSDAMKAYDSGDKNLALAYGKIAATNGDEEAQILVGHILMRGETGLVDTAEAAKWFQKAALKDNPDALVGLAEIALRSQAGLTPPDAVPYLERAAALGRLDAMRVLADAYEQGTGVPQSTAKAMEWRGKAAREGDALAARAMGDETLERDAFEALQWYEHAATLGDPQSAYIAAIMYVENFEIRPDRKKSAVLLRQAADANIAAAMADYGLIVYQGVGVEQSNTSAAKWFERAAKAGDSEGQFLYAFTLAKGEGIEQNFEDSYFWLLRSGESGVDDYNADRKALRERLEANVDGAVLTRARTRFNRIVKK